MMPVVGSESFFGRPASITSGTSLENKVVIQRRSDVLLEEQVILWISGPGMFNLFRKFSIFGRKISNFKIFCHDLEM